MNTTNSSQMRSCQVFRAGARILHVELMPVLALPLRLSLLQVVAIVVTIVVGAGAASAGAYIDNR